MRFSEITSNALFEDAHKLATSDQVSLVDKKQDRLGQNLRSMDTVKVLQNRYRQTDRQTAGFINPTKLNHPETEEMDPRYC